MATINNKPFDASKKIRRASFQGAPNLLTSPDINRQGEATWQAVSMANNIAGIISDLAFTVNHTVTSATAATINSITATGTYLKYCGIQFSFPTTVTPPASMALTTSDVFYVTLFAKENNVTFDTDGTHEISGAVFSDSTQLPAANHYVLSDEEIKVFKNTIPATSSGKVFVALLGYFYGVPSGRTDILMDLVTVNNCYLENRWARHSGIVQNLPADNTSTILKNGLPTDTALKVLENQSKAVELSMRDSTASFHRFESVSPGDGSTPPGAVNIFMSWKVFGGLVYLIVRAEHTINLPTSEINSTHFNFSEIGIPAPKKTIFVGTSGANANYVSENYWDAVSGNSVGPTVVVRNTTEVGDSGVFITITNTTANQKSEKRFIYPIGNE